MPATGARGFTLVELMIGVAVVGILLALAAPSYSTWIQNSRIRNTAESILNGLQLARAEAVSRNAQVDFALVGGSGWRVGCPVVTALCPETIQSRPAGEGSSSAVTVATVGGPTIRFNNFGRRVLPDPAGGVAVAAINVDITPSVMPAAQTRDLRITIDVGGNVRMCDPNVTSPTDARAC
ncbi:MAG: GspH/FimT family pseudopilin [Noviherbaspirillum sp.]